MSKEQLNFQFKLISTGTLCWAQLATEFLPPVEILLLDWSVILYILQWQVLIRIL